MNKRTSYFFIILLSLSLTACSGPKDSATLLIEAESLIQKGETPEAVINLKNILQKDPNHYQARFLLGSAYLSTNDYQSAEKEFQRSLKVNPDNNKAILMLAKTHINLNQFNNVVYSLKDKELVNIEDQIYGSVLLGQAYLGLDDLFSAKEQIQKANDLNSNSLHSILGTALLYAYEERNEEALNLADKLIDLDSNHSQAWLLKGSIYSKQQNFLLAAEAYEAYYSLNNENIGIRTLVAHNYIRAGSFERAKLHIDDLIKKNDNHPTINTLAAQLKYSERDYTSAKELADSVVNATNNGLAQMISGLSNFHLKNYEQAYYELNAIADHLPKAHQVNKVLAILQVKLGYTEELQETLEKISDLTTADAAVFANIGMEFINKGDKESALDMLNKARLLAPEDESIQAQLGIFKLRNSDKSGVKNLEKAIELSPTFKTANIALAMNYLKNGQVDKAKAIANQWIENDPMNSSALILSGNIALKVGETDNAISYFLKAREIDTENLIARFNLAVMASEQGNYKESNSYLDEILAIDLEYSIAYRLAISNSLHQNKPEELKIKLQSMIENKPEGIWPRVILARRLTAEKEYKKALEFLDYPKSYKELPTPYWQILSKTLLASEQDQKLTKMYSQWQKEQPTNETAYLDYINILDKRKDYSNALAVIKKGLLQENLSSNLQLLALESYYLLETEQLELASKKVKMLARSYPNNAFILRVQGQIALFHENYSNAVDYLFRSYKLNKKVTVGLFLIDAYKKTNQEQEAIEFLSAELKISPQIDAYKKSLAELYVSSFPKKAINLYQQLLLNYPNDTIILNNLAWTHYQQDNLEEAYIYAKKAQELSPTHPKILDTYGLILIKQNKLNQAIESLTLAYSLAPADFEIRSHLANAYIENNQEQKANQLLEHDKVTTK